MGLEEKVVKVAEYCYSLGDVLNGGVNESAMIIDLEEDYD